MTATTKKTTLELSINTEYVSHLGTWFGGREILQNGADEHDLGNALTVRRDAKGTIKIRNEGSTLDRDTLLLGTTSKAGRKDQRGQFGEGYKLAFLTLLRAGVDIEVRTRTELWTPILEKSDTYGVEVLKVKCRPCLDKGYVEFQLKGLSKKDWELIKDRVLFIGKAPAKCQNIGQDKILMAQKHQGSLYCNGLWVGQLPESHAYGYDLSDVELDRDRKMADPWSLKWEIANVLKRAVQMNVFSSKQILDLAQQGEGEASALRAYGSGDLSRALVEAFRAEHGEDAIPVSSLAESNDASMHSLHAIMVSKAVQSVFEEQEGSLEQALAKRRLIPTSYYGTLDLSDDENNALVWAGKLVASVEDSFSMGDLAVVDFGSDKIIGTFSSDNGVRIAKRIVSDRSKLIATLVHEVAHKYGSDGSVDHRYACERIFGDIIANER